jgi:hypothetical protein
MASLTEKHESENIEHIPNTHHADSTVGERGFVTDDEDLPKGYFYSPFFLGTTCAVGLNLMVCTSTLVFSHSPIHIQNHH